MTNSERSALVAIAMALILNFSTSRAFEVARGAPMAALETPAGATGCDAFDLNHDGSVVVGYCDDMPARWIDGKPELLSGPIKIAYADGSTSESPVIFGIAYGINARGTILGWVISPEQAAAAIWDESDRTWIALSKEKVSKGYDISDSGIVAGRAGSLGAAVWDRGDVMLLDPVPGTDFCLAFTVNNRGVAAGQCVEASGTIETAVVWRTDGTVDAMLGQSDGLLTAYGRGISGRGDVVGILAGAAMLWDASDYNPVQLAPLGAANGINSQGDIVGYVGINGGQGADVPRAVIWRAGTTTPEPLGTLGGDTSFARAVNESGIVVGNSSDAAGNQTAFVVWP